MKSILPNDVLLDRGAAAAEKQFRRWRRRRASSVFALHDSERTKVSARGPSQYLPS